MTNYEAPSEADNHQQSRLYLTLPQTVRWRNQLAAIADSPLWASGSRLLAPAPRLDGVRERTIVTHPDLLDRFRSSAADLPPILSEHPDVAATVSTDVLAAVAELGTATAARLPIPHDRRRQLTLGAFQFTAMSAAGAARGKHCDNWRHGDLILTVIVRGAGVVTVERAEAATHAERVNTPLVRLLQAGSAYALFDEGLHPARHAVTAHDGDRLSITYRFVGWTNTA